MSTSAFAQNTDASLSGSVLDSTGAAIPQVKITLTNDDTRLSQSVVSSDSGNFVLTPLPPGHYTVSAERDGFRRHVQSGILLTVAQKATLNLTLQVGNASEIVSVNSTPEMINATSPDLSTIVDARAIQELPLNGRDPSTLVLLAPGMTNGLRLGVLQATNSFPGETGASSSGAAPEARITFSMVLATSIPTTSSPLPFPMRTPRRSFVSQRTISMPAMEFAPGAVVSIQTKSGTNAFHGGAFEFLRNDAFNARNWFNKSIDTLKRNQFGAFLGGPIIADKLFFFTNYQGTRSISTSADSHTNAPTQAMLNGDFTAVPKTLAGGFVGNRIDPKLFSPGALALVKNVPLGQDPATGIVYYSSPVTRVPLNEGTARIDWQVNQAQRLSVRSFIGRFSRPQGSIPGNIVTAVLGDDGRYWNEASIIPGSLVPEWSTLFRLRGFAWTSSPGHSSLTRMAILSASRSL